MMLRNWIKLWMIGLTLLVTTAALGAQKGIIIQIEGPIGPATQDYVTHTMAKAHQEKAALIILEMNTPGGLETAMRGINQQIIASSIPVVSYVSPSGARAASAGTFIAYASHLSFMAPGTNLGAASPISLTGSDKTKNTAMNKAQNDASAYIRSLAQLRERNVEWAQKAVEQAASLSAQEALKQNVIDGIADDYKDLLVQLDQQNIIVGDQSFTLSTKDLVLEKAEPSWRFEFLSFITNPNIAYILMLIAIYGLFFELSNPGAVLPGVVGVIALFLVLYAFQWMSINYVGLALVFVGITFMLFELFVPSFGALGLGGLIAFVMGSVMLFDTPFMPYPLAWSLVVTMTGMTALFFFIVLNLAIKSFKKHVVTGSQGLIGQIGTVLGQDQDGKLIVQVQGEIWRAHSTESVKVGQQVHVFGREGLTLDIVPIHKDEANR